MSEAYFHMDIGRGVVILYFNLECVTGEAFSFPIIEGNV